MIKMTKTMLFTVAGVAGVFCFGNAFAEDAAPVAAVVSPVTQQIDIPEKIQDLDKVKITYDGQTYACPDRCRFETYSNGGYVLPPRCIHKQTGAECKAMVSAAQSNSSNQAVIVVPLKVESVNLKADEVSDVHKKANANVAARAAKIKPTLKQTTQVKPNPTPIAQDKLADGGDVVAINCPAGCTPDCVILGNVVMCECKTSDGKNCKAEVVTADSTSQNK